MPAPAKFATLSNVITIDFLPYKNHMVHGSSHQALATLEKGDDIQTLRYLGGDICDICGFAFKWVSLLKSSN